MSMPEWSATDCLQQARKIYRDANASYRDALLECGRWLHRYILACLKSADHMGKFLRRKHSLSREKIILSAARKLRTSCPTIRRLAESAITVDLLSDNGQIGELGYRAITIFRSCIQRVSPVRGQRRLGSNAEVWEVKPQYRESGPHLFQQAAREGWSSVQVSKILPKMRTYPERAHPNLKQLPNYDYRAAAIQASFGDAVTMIADVLTVRDDGRRVLAAVTTRLTSTLEKELSQVPT